MIIIKGKFKEYTKEPTSSGLSGKEIAEKMLRDNGIYDVEVVSVPGFLSDHYDPTKKELFLSSENYHSTSIAAVGVAFGKFLGVFIPSISSSIIAMR